MLDMEQMGKGTERKDDMESFWKLEMLEEQ